MKQQVDMKNEAIMLLENEISRLKDESRASSEYERNASVVQSEVEQSRVREFQANESFGESLIPNLFFFMLL
jgi:hypothetical protein